jgi:hypothetical protein
MAPILNHQVTVASVDPKQRKITFHIVMENNWPPLLVLLQSQIV